MGLGRALGKPIWLPLRGRSLFQGAWQRVGAMGCHVVSHPPTKVWLCTGQRLKPACEPSLLLVLVCQACQASHSPEPVELTLVCPPLLSQAVQDAAPKPQPNQQPRPAHFAFEFDGLDFYETLVPSTQ